MNQLVSNRIKTLEDLADSPFNSEAEMLREASNAAIHALYNSKDIGLPVKWLHDIFCDLKFGLSENEAIAILIELEQLGFCQYSVAEKRAYISGKGLDLRDYRCAALDCIARPASKWF